MRWKFVSFAAAMLMRASAETLAVVDPFEKIDMTRTVVWSPLFQATWDAMNETFGDKPEKIDPPDELMARLDSFEWDIATVMPETGWQVWGGKASREFLAAVNTEVTEMTGEKDDHFDLGNLKSEDVACFGLLNRDVEFSMGFHESKKRPMEFKTGGKKKNVKFFGVRGGLSSNYGYSIRVLAYHEDTHALEIKSRRGDDRVVLYLPLENQGFDAACASLRKLRDRPADMPGSEPHFGAGDDLRVPYMSVETFTDFSKRLAGGRYYGIEGDPWKIVRAQQKTEFDLFENGARVKVRTSLGVEPFAGSPPPPPKPRNFIYDRPFFVFLWRERAEWPYFGVWAGDDSALLKF